MNEELQRAVARELYEMSERSCIELDQDKLVEDLLKEWLWERESRYFDRAWLPDVMGKGGAA